MTIEKKELKINQINQQSTTQHITFFKKTVQETKDYPTLVQQTTIRQTQHRNN